MAIVMRNALMSEHTNTNQVGRWMIWVFREMFELAGWTEVYKTTNSAWESGSNIVLTIGDATVAAATPYKITSTTGGFTSSHVDECITLKATTDANKGIYRITNVIDSNNLYIDPATGPIGGWTDEGSITAEIHKCGQPVILGTNTELVMQAPASSGSSLQIYMKVTSLGYAFDFYALPKGDWDGARTATETVTVSMNASSVRTRVNMYADGQNILIFLYHNVAGRYIICAGELTNVVTGDDYPGFITVGDSWDMFLSSDLSRVYMLDDADNPIKGYPMGMMSAYSGGDYFDRTSGRRTINGGRTRLESPLIFMQDVSTGGYPRGKLPILKMANNSYESFRQLDSSNLNLHISDGTVIIGNGVNDRAIIDSASI
jgi:hypothetical protein